MKYYLNGNKISEQAAREIFSDASASQGYCEDDYESIWSARSFCEESRELINELSNYELEIIAC
jgi:hypothetical protein